MVVEFLLVHEDGTWTTEIIPDCPLKEKDDRKVALWARNHRFTTSFYDKVLRFYIWAYDPGGE